MPFQKSCMNVTSATGVITVTLDASTANGAVSADAVALDIDSNPGGTAAASPNSIRAARFLSGGPAIHNGSTTISNNGMRGTNTRCVDHWGQLASESVIVNSGTSLFAGTIKPFPGTSLSVPPSWAGLIAVADQGRALSGLAPLTGSTQTLPMLYSLPTYVFHEITIGFNGYEAGTGYDLVNGLGSPNAQLVSAGLGGVVASGDYNVSAFNVKRLHVADRRDILQSRRLHGSHRYQLGRRLAPTPPARLSDRASTACINSTGLHDYAKQGLYKITVHISFGPSAGVAVKSAATVSPDIGILLLDPTGRLRICRNRVMAASPSPEAAILSSIPTMPKLRSNRVMARFPRRRST